MTVEELRAEAEKLGYYITKKRNNPKIVGKKCGNCKFLTGEHSCIGIECQNPCREWRTKTARFKYKHTPACRMFVEREVADDE